MRQIAFVAVFFITVFAVGSIHADYVRVIKDPSECEEQNNSCQSCTKKRCKRCRPCYVRSCNPYKRSCVDDDYDEPAASWPAYWDQPLMEELSR